MSEGVGSWAEGATANDIPCWLHISEHLHDAQATESINRLPYGEWLLLWLKQGR